MKAILSVSIIFASVFILNGQNLLVSADRLFDGIEIHDNWSVLVSEDVILRVDKTTNFTSSDYDSQIILNGTVLPGMIEGHSHMLLHPYDETSWIDQVLKEAIAERSIRAANHAKATLDAGFTFVRDLGAEGAGYADVGLKESIIKRVVPGPRMQVAGPAIVVTGSYGPKGFADHVKVPLGANEADGIDDLIREVRTQIGKGADIIKVYMDYRWGPFGQAMPTFTQDEIDQVVNVANSSGREVVAHAATAEGMRRAIIAGVQSIEHGDAATKEVFELMKKEGVALCPTIAAGDAIAQYRGWKKGIDEEPDRIKNKRASMMLALDTGVDIIAGGDVGVFSHGENVRELELMVDYGMSAQEVLIAVTSGNAKLLSLPKIGSLKPNMYADIIAVDGDPTEDISSLRQVSFVMKGGVIYKHEKQ